VTAVPIGGSPGATEIIFIPKPFNQQEEPMIFQIVAMICVAGMEPRECAPEPGHSRDVAIVGEVPNEMLCGIQAQQTLGGIAVFQNLAPGEFIKTMYVRKG
jgi:hypothetical protein